MLVAMALGSVLSAQTRPVISIKVHTDSGVPISSAVIRVERDRSFAVQAISDAEGKAEIPGLATGQYRLTVSADGFQESALSISVYDVRQTIETDLTLVPRLHLSEAVDVVAT